MSDEPTAPIRIAIADDQELIRMGLKMVLDVQPDVEVVAEAADGIAATELDLATLDVILMDVRMPGLDGIAATARIVASPDAPRILVLTTFDLDEYAFAAIRAGASGFLLKDAKPDDLLAAIRAVHSGDAALAPSVTRKLMERFAAAPGGLTASGMAKPAGSAPGEGITAETSSNAADSTSSRRSPLATEHLQAGSAARRVDGAPAPAPGRPAPSAFDSLTPREREILAAIAEGLSNDELAERFFLSSSTIKTHIGRLLQKLGARDRVHLVILAYESGLA